MTDPRFPLMDSTGTRWADAAPKRTLKPLVREPDMPMERVDSLELFAIKAACWLFAVLAVFCAVSFA